MAPKSNPHSGFRRRLTAWFRAAGRDLPWRRTRDAYAIVVSEFMLQQTQVSRVLDYYPRFLKRYPTVGHLARARPAAVRESWDGLGYYRRAANLHAMARVVVREYGGELPSDVAELRKLPGIGQYTAGAVACFAYERAEATVDTNVGRVLERFFGYRRPKTGDRKSKGRALQELAMAIQPRNGAAAWTFNQALMELGALICTARKPSCGSCPVQEQCAWPSKNASTL
jgi:A/G-specific adenine glycosylase